MIKQSIGPKIVLSYVTIFFLAVITVSVSLFSLDRVISNLDHTLHMSTQPMDYLNKFSVAFNELRATIRDLSISTTSSQNEMHRRTILNCLEEMETQMYTYAELLADNIDIADQDEVAAVAEILGILKTYRVVVAEELIPAGVANNNDTVTELIYNDLKEPGYYMRDLMVFLSDLNIAQAEANTGNAHTLAFEFYEIDVYVLNIIIILVFMLVLLVIAVVFTRSIILPLNTLVKNSRDIAMGNLSQIHPIETTHYELDQLSKGILEVVKVIRLVVQDLDVVSKDMKEGRIQTRLDIKFYRGEYQVVAEAINNMIDTSVQENREMIACINDMAKGDFSTKLREFQGEKVVINHVFEALRLNLLDVSNQINFLLMNALEGNLAVQTDGSKHKGEWLAILNKLNHLMSVIEAPIRETKEVLAQMAEGQFDARITGDYGGIFNDMKNSINDMENEISTYIYDIGKILKNLSNDDFNQEITREYKGYFSSIKTALNMLIEKTNNIFATIRNASNSVLIGSQQLSEQSVQMAQGASAQNSTIEELRATVGVINEAARSNAENAVTADAIADRSKENASLWKDYMFKMTESINAIGEASESILQIIQVISNIAFETNMLALNAAVEAARAGQHGKGFSVVAEQVRQLASNSYKASEETEALIESTVDKVLEGQKIAGDTELYLKKVLDDITQVSNLIECIAHDTNEQANSISEINEGIDEIARVAQENATFSEETASAAEEFTDQVGQLHKLMSVYRLKERTHEERANLVFNKRQNLMD